MVVMIGFAVALATAGALVALGQLDRDTHQTRATATPASFNPSADDARAFGIDMSSFVLRGRFLDRAGKRYSIGRIRETDPSGECIAVVGPGGDVGSACSQPRLFSGGPVVWVEGFEGGPAPVDRTSEYIAGIATDPVKRIAVVQSDGSSRAAPLSSANGFFYAVDPHDLARGIYVDHLDAIGANGDLVQRIALNDGS